MNQFNVTRGDRQDSSEWVRGGRCDACGRFAKSVLRSVRYFALTPDDCECVETCVCADCLRKREEEAKARKEAERVEKVARRDEAVARYEAKTGRKARPEFVASLNEILGIE